MTHIDEILSKENFSKEDIIRLLDADDHDIAPLFHKAQQCKAEGVGKKVYFRGLIEYSNRCSKNCYYCGIRSENTRYQRYELTDEEVLEAVKYAWENNFASVVIQSGERSGPQFTEHITRILTRIHQMTGGTIHVTLSLGEQSEDTYRSWMEAGAHRYLLRIEASNRELYRKLHPSLHHDYDVRMEALHTLKRIGYQVGTGVMIGLPWQTTTDLAEDLLFFRDFDVDMIGMGPWIEHEDTPLFAVKHLAPPPLRRLDLSIRMVAILRIMMPDINIAATTAMQTLDPSGRERALYAGANVIMPNLTPVRYRDNYLLYKDKPNVKDQPEETKAALEEHILRAGDVIGYGEWGDSRHFRNRMT